MVNGSSEKLKLLLFFIWGGGFYSHASHIEKIIIKNIYAVDALVNVNLEGSFNILKERYLLNEFIIFYLAVGCWQLLVITTSHIILFTCNNIQFFFQNRHVFK